MALRKANMALHKANMALHKANMALRKAIESYIQVVKESMKTGVQFHTFGVNTCQIHTQYSYLPYMGDFTYKAL